MDVVFLQHRQKIKYIRREKLLLGVADHDGYLYKSDVSRSPWGDLRIVDAKPGGAEPQFR